MLVLQNADTEHHIQLLTCLRRGDLKNSKVTSNGLLQTPESNFSADLEAKPTGASIKI